MKKITVYGVGCPSCHKLYERVEKVLKKNKIDADLENIGDINILIDKGIVQVPALEVDGIMKCMGRVPKEKELLLYFV